MRIILRGVVSGRLEGECAGRTYSEQGKSVPMESAGFILLQPR